MEEFSQSRGDDDLFDDEIVPFEPSQQDTLEAQVQQISLQPKAAPVQAQTRNDDYPRDPRGANVWAQRAQSKKDNLAKKNDLVGSKWATQPSLAPTTQEAPVPLQETSEPPLDTSETPSVADPTAETTTPSAPAVQTPARPAAVRGDRTGTGGVKKPKLTEDELSAKLLAAKERSQNLSAAHARAQADAASFEERERVAQRQRAEEAVNRRQMDNERQKNAARKAAAMGGREWDVEKNEEDFKISRGGERRGRGGTMRAMNGTSVNRSDPSLDDLSQYQWHEGRGRGRGDRGRGRGARVGRGDARGGARQPNVKAEADFPSLPAPKPAKDDKQSPRPIAARSTSNVLSPSGEKTSWADQVGEEA
jgi:hypothetical protein